MKQLYQIEKALLRLRGGKTLSPPLKERDRTRQDKTNLIKSCHFADFRPRREKLTPGERAHAVNERL